MEASENMAADGAISWSELLTWMEWLTIWSVSLYLTFRLNGGQFWWLLIWIVLFAFAVARRANALKTLARSLPRRLGITARALFR